jgi:aminoglycoside phosphotransferase
MAGRLTFEDDNTVRKRGPAWRLRREVEAMEYVRRNTSLPIPAIIEVHSDMESEKESSWVLMERIPGLELGVAWPTMSENARSETIRQLRSFFEQLY